MKHCFKKDADGNSYLKCAFDVAKRFKGAVQDGEFTNGLAEEVKKTMTFQDSEMSEHFSGGKLGKACAFFAMPVSLTVTAIVSPIAVPAAILSVASDEHKKNLSQPKKPNGPDFDKM